MPANDEPRSRPAGPIRRTLYLFFGLFGVLALSLVINIIIEWLGIAFWWPDEGANHSLSMVRAELSWANASFRGAILDAPALTHYFTSESTQLIKSSGLWSLASEAIDTPFGPYLLATIYHTQLFAIRLANAVLSLPGFLIVGALAVIDGLVQRDLRRLGGGHESSFIYDRARPFIWPAIFLSWLLYLSMPWSIHPTWMLLPGMLVFGLALHITTYRFKKYL